MDSPHRAVIKFNINIFEILHDDSLSPNPLTSTEIEELGITKTAVFVVDGFNKSDCVSKLEEVLRGLSYGQT